MRFRRSGSFLAVVLCAACVLCADGFARAAEPVRARLVYLVASGVDRCPEDAEVRESVAARLGYDPFVLDAEQEVVVRIEPRGRGLTGSLIVRGGRGAKPAQREISSPSADCRELVDALGTAIAIRLDPASLDRAPTSTLTTVAKPAPGTVPPTEASARLGEAGESVPAAQPSPPPAPSASSSTVPSPSDRGEPSDADATVQVGLAVVGIFGELPAPVAGLDLSTRVRLRWASIGVEGEATLPASRAVGSASREVSASLLSTAVVPCVHRAPFVACIVARFGALRAEGSGVDVPARESSFYASLAMRIGAEFRSSRTTSFLANVDGVAPLTRVALDLGATEAWVVPSFGVRASVGARMQF